MNKKEKRVLGEETIVAVSTAEGKGAIGIVRCSGRGVREVLEKVIPSLKGKIEDKKVKVGWLKDPINGEKVDEVVVLFFEGPKSFTGEDVGEIHGHGGKRNIERIVSIVSENGARPARPGEFSYRAFLNGRMDLTKAEAIAKLIEAKTKKACEIAVKQLGGQLEEKIERIRSEVVGIMVEMEARIDFPEEDLEIEEKEESRRKLEEVVGEVKKIIESFHVGKLVSGGATVGIVGRTNVGKSSLLNRLVGKKRALVDEVPGTTRDYVDAEVEVGGYLVRFVDTAGLREGSGDLEKKGAELAKKELKKADLVICMMEANEGIKKEDREVMGEYAGKKRIVVWNKMDLVDEKNIQGEKIWEGEEIKISVKEGKGLDRLKEKIREEITGEKKEEWEGIIIMEKRHEQILRETKRMMKRALKGMGEGIPSEIIEIDLREAKKKLGELIGREVEDEVLDGIFSKFCVGK